MLWTSAAHSKLYLKDNKENKMEATNMTWKDARKKIEKNIRVGTDVNTEKSNYRFVKCVCDYGFKIPRGKTTDMRITWDLLEDCWRVMKKNNGDFDKGLLKKSGIFDKYPGCCVQTIYMIFSKAGLL